MAVKAGKIILDAGNTGAGGWDVTGIGFEPNAVLFIYCDMTVEDTWEKGSAGIIQGGMGLASKFNSLLGGAGSVGTGIENCCSMQLWYGGSGDNASSAGNPAISVLTKSDHSNFSYSTSIRSFNADGWNMRYANSGTLNTNAHGKIIYYLAFGPNRKTAFDFPDSVPGSDATKITTTALGFPPVGALMVGHPTTSYVNNAFDSYGAAKFGTVGWKAMSLAKAQGRRFIPIGGGDASFWDELTDGHGHVFDYDNSGFSKPADWYESTFDVTVPDTLKTSVYGASGFSWSANYVRFGQLIFGDAAIAMGEFIPNTVVDDTPVVEDIGITPEAIIFMAGPHNATDFVWDAPNQDELYNGQTMIGFATENFQCVVTWGGVLTGNGSRFCSSSRAWVSNYVDTLPLGDNPTMGIVDLTPTGFTHVTKQHDAASPHRVLYWAIGDLGAPITYGDISFNGLKAESHQGSNIIRVY